MTDFTELNALAAWLGVLAGIVTGAVAGLSFHRDDWLGGYASWPRRMMRLGHVAFFGIAALNLGFTLTVRRLGWTAPPAACVALASAIVLMPGVCYLAAWRKPMRHLFVLPVGAVLVGVVGLLYQRVLPWFA